MTEGESGEEGGDSWRASREERRQLGSGEKGSDSWREWGDWIEVIAGERGLWIGASAQQVSVTAC